MKRRSRPISTRVRILGTILAVAFVGFLVVGGVTFLVQRERILNEVDVRLHSQIATLDEMATPAPSPSPSPTDNETTTEELGDSADSTVEAYVREAVRRLVPG